MASSVFFKFKSQKEPQRVTFDGTGLSVFELKREIIKLSQLGDGTDFDLTIHAEDSNEEYDDDTTIIPRSTSVIARRLPASKPGQGRAARYVSGRMPANAKNSYRNEQANTLNSTSKHLALASQGAAAMEKAQTEEEKIAAMNMLGAEQWEMQQQYMASATAIHRPGGMKGKPVNVPDHKPPPGYICYRCGEKGHWIQACPTNGDSTFDGRPRVKRTTGIPRSFLQTIEKPASLQNDGLTDDARQPSGVMVNAEGDFVVALPDKASWDQYQAKAQASAAQEDVSISGSEELQSRGLECPLDKRLFVDPMKTPCCGKTYCNDCIENALVNSDLVCPGCLTAGVLIDSLIIDAEMNTKIKAYQEEKKSEKKLDEKLASPSTSNASSTSENVKSPSPAAAARQAESDAIESPSKSQKRPAEDELKNDRKPPSPTPENLRKTTSEQGPNANPTTNGFDHSFMEQMNTLAPASMPLNPLSFPMNMSMPSVMGIPPPMMNPMMMIQPFGVNTMGMNNMNGMGFPQQWPGANPAMYGMMNGFPPPQQMPNWPGVNGSSPWPNNMQQSMPNQQYPQSQNLQNGGGTPNHPGTFPHQQYSHLTGNDQGDDAYMRKPVNPHRHQGRQRKVRPVEYREL